MLKYGMRKTLSFDLHTLTARLDRAADQILRAEHGLSYRRFRTLLSVQLLGETPSPVTQRAVAEELGISEPSASRMTGVLVTAGLLEARPGEGNSRRLSLTPDGEHLVDRCRSLLEKRFADLVEESGVDYADYARDTAKLLAAISR